MIGTTYLQFPSRSFLRHGTFGITKEHSMSKRRVVVTGMGIISPVGNDIASAWERVLKGVSGIGPVTHFDTSAYSTRIAGQVSGFDPAQWMPIKDVKKMDPFIHYGIAASIQALGDAGLHPHEHDAERIGVAADDGVLT